MTNLNYNESWLEIFFDEDEIAKFKELTADSELLVDSDGVKNVGSGDGPAVLLHHLRELPAQRVTSVLVQRPSKKTQDFYTPS